MPDPPAQAQDAPAPPPTAPGAAGEPVVQAKREPLIEVDTLGERVGLVGMALLLAGSVLPWAGPSLASWGPLSLDALALIPLTIGIMASMQVLSAASKAGDVVMLGLAAACGVGAVLAKAGQPLAAGEPWGVGMYATLLGAAVGLVSMEMLRREASLDYVAMATRALDLAMQPRVQFALLKLLIPFAAVGVFAFFVLEAYGEAVANKLGATFLLYFFNPLGKEVGIPFALSTAFPPAIDPALTWLFIVFIDVVTALFLVWNFDHVLKVPFIGRFFAWVVRRGNEAVVKYKWIGRLAFFGLAAYATLPLEGTGAIGGSVVGRAIGLSATATFFAVCLGSVIRTTVTTLLVVGALHALGL